MESTFGQGTAFKFSIPYLSACAQSTDLSDLKTDQNNSFDFQDISERNHNRQTLDDYELSPNRIFECFRIPTTDNSIIIPLISSNNASLRKSNFSFQEKRVLVVDDNPFNHLATSFLLEKFGIKAEKVLGGPECLDLLRKNYKFSFIFMDIQMPIMDGVETTKRIKEMVRNKEIEDIPIIALTATKEKDGEKLYLESGMVKVCQKPLKEKDLKQLINKYCP